MEVVNGSVVAFFILSTFLLGVLGFKFKQTGSQPFANFGLGLLLVAAAFLIWTYIVAAHPDNIQAITTLGVIPFMASFVLFLLAATSGVSAKYRVPFYVTGIAVLSAFIVVRFLLFQSDPGFTDNGYFAFNVDPVVLYFYAMVAAFSFIPAVYVVGRQIKNDLLRIGVELGLTLVAVGLIIMLTNNDENLQLINGFGIIAGLLLSTVSVLAYPLKKNIR